MPNSVGVPAGLAEYPPLYEFYRITFKQEISTSMGPRQVDSDAWLENYSA